MEKVFNGSNKFWNWLLVSSEDPQKASLFVRGIFSLGGVQAIFSVLPLLGIHLSFSLDNVSDIAYTITYGGLTMVSAAFSIIGAARKLVNLFAPKTQK